MHRLLLAICAIVCCAAAVPNVCAAAEWPNAALIFIADQYAFRASSAAIIHRMLVDGRLNKWLMTLKANCWELPLIHDDSGRLTTHCCTLSGPEPDRPSPKWPAASRSR